MNRAEYLVQAHAYAKRGMELPQSKLTPLEVSAIRSAAKQRENLLNYIREKLSNQALATSYGVSVRCVERVMARETWSHV